jgi:D-alanyl-D-alanine carboxypeptidase/D-alanyl-D-alanine-endopeptidase (penicillin-binding protein 4)
LIRILRELAQWVPMEKLQQILPKTGQSGTLRNAHLTHGVAWAKSGSFGNTYDLSGFYRDKRGKIYVFSLLTNLANRSVTASKADVITLLNALR